MHSPKGDPSWSRILVVEGVPGVGKSTLLDALLRRHVEESPPRKLRTVLHLTQAHTYGPLAPAEDAGTLTPTEALAHLEAVVGILEWQVGALTAEATPKLFALVDTLHLTHCHRPGVLGWTDVAPLDARLATLGFRLLFLRANADTLWKRAVSGRADTQFIRTYAPRRWGSSLEAIHRGLVEEQAAMEAQLGRTQLVHRVLDVDGSVDESLETSYRFWKTR